MKLTITPKAKEWFEKEVGATSGSYIRFYGKIYGKTNIHEGFSVGLSVEEPIQIHLQQQIDGVTYYIDESDRWFFEDYQLIVDYDAQYDEPKYTFLELED